MARGAPSHRRGPCPGQRFAVGLAVGLLLGCAATWTALPMWHRSDRRVTLRSAYQERADAPVEETVTRSKEPALANATRPGASAGLPSPRQPAKHNFILTVNNNFDFLFFPPLVAAVYARHLGVRPYVLMYDLEPDVAGLIRSTVTALGGVAATLRAEDNPATLQVPRKPLVEKRRIDRKKQKIVKALGDSKKRKIDKALAESLTPFERGTATAYQLDAKRFVQSVRMAGPCAVSRAVYRDYGEVLHWPSDSFMWIADVDSIPVSKHYMFDDISEAPIHVWNGRCCHKPNQKWLRLPPGWKSMLPMPYIGARVPVLQELFGLPKHGLEQCNIAAVMSDLAQDPGLYFHGNLDQIVAMRRANVYCGTHANMSVMEDFRAHKQGEEVCVQTKPRPRRLSREDSPTCGTRCDDVHLKRPGHVAGTWHGIRKLVAEFLDDDTLEVLDGYREKFCSLEAVGRLSEAYQCERKRDA